MTDSLDVAGIVLAGGRSRRLGRNKAVELLGGKPLVRRVIDRLADVVDQTVVVVADLEQAERLPLPDSTQVIVDAYPTAARWAAYSRACRRPLPTGGSSSPATCRS